jgi:hypothetical protein
MRKFETYLPVFPGFYGTWFESTGEDLEIEDINRQREEKKLAPLQFDDLDFDYEDYRLTVSKECTDAIETALQSIINGSIKVNFQKLVSPKQYNFVNDSVNIEVELDDEAMKSILDILAENKDAFKKHIVGRYTSCSGFISSHSNDSNKWLETLKTWDKELLSHKLGAVLDFILQNVDGYDEESLYYSIETRNVYVKNYDELLTKTKED